MEHSYHNFENISKIASRLKSVIETAVDGIITINERGTIEFANPTICKIFEYDATELIGQNIALLMPSPHHEKHDDYLQHYQGTIYFCPLFARGSLLDNRFQIIEMYIGQFVFQCFKIFG